MFTSKLLITAGIFGTVANPAWMFAAGKSAMNPNEVAEPTVEPQMVPRNPSPTPVMTENRAELIERVTPVADADNSKKNQLHDGESGVSADQQSNSERDIELTRKIRRAITQDKSLSTYAHNVKIIAINGAVTLKGPVRDPKEKATIEQTAAQFAGKINVQSEIEISGK